MFKSNEDNPNNKNHDYFLRLILFLMMLLFFCCKIMQSSFRLASGSPPFGIIKGITCFSWSELCFEMQAGYIFFFYNVQTINSNSYIIFLNFFLVIFFWLKMFSFPIIFIYKTFSSCYSSRMFPISSLFHVTVIAHWKQKYFFYWCDLLLLFCFSSNQ